MKHGSILFAAAALAFSSASWAQDGDDEKTPTTAEELQKIRETLDTLTSDQKTETLAPNGGQTEADLLSAAALKAGAAGIADHLNSSGLPANSELVLLESDQTLNLDRFLILQIQLKAFERRAIELNARALGVVPKMDGENEDSENTFGLLGAEIEAGSEALKLISSLFDSTTVISDLSTTDLTDAELVSAVSTTLCGRNPALGGKAFRCFAPSLLVLTTLSGNELYKTLTDTDEAMIEVASGPNSNDAKVKKLLTDYSTYLTSITTESDGTTKFLEGLRGAALAKTLRGKNNIYFLRLSVDGNGGTLIDRKNIWTALGASQLSIAGMVRLSFSATDINGFLHSSGVAVCGTDLTSFSKVQKELSTAAKCVTSMQ